MGTSYLKATQLIDENDVAYGVKQTNNEIHVLAKETALPPDAATNTILTDGSQKAIIVDPITGDTAEVAISTSDADNLDGKYGLVTNAILHGRLDADNTRPIRIDSSTHSLQTITYEHHEIHSGSHYYISGHQQFSNGQVKDFTIITPNTTKWTHLLFTVQGSGAESVNIYEGATVNVAGTAVTSFNNNRNSVNVTGNTIRTGDTFTSTGTLISRRFAGSNKSSGTISRGSELILKQNTTYILRITNETTLANDISWDAEWYEHTSKA